MQALAQVAQGLATGALAFLLGLLWRRLNKALLNYRARRFWRPVMSKDLQLVLGRFRGLQGFEASGVIGAGDSLAMNNLNQYFEQIGYGGFRVSYNDQLGFGDTLGESLRTNLILLGGPDANSLTYDIVKRLNLGIAFKELDPTRPGVLLEPRIFDFAAVAEHSASTLFVRRILQTIGLVSAHQWRTPVMVDKVDREKVYQPSKEGDNILTDCGVIIRAPNPFEPTKQVILLCGSYGYGTWAAVQLAQDKEFLRQVPKRAGPLECIFQVDVVRDTPQRPRLYFVRETPDSAVPG